MPAVATTVAKNISALSQVKLPAAVKAPPPPPAPAPKPSSIVSVGKQPPALGLYSAPPKPAPEKAAAPAAPPKPAAPVAPPKPAPKPEVLNTADGAVIAGKGRVVLDIEASDSGYDNKIYYSTDNFKTKIYVGVDNKTGSVDLGTFKEGTKIQFGIDNGQGDFFRTGSKSVNTDKTEHARAAKTSDGGVRIGFEDLRGGGDRDFNDAIIKVRSVPQGAPPIVNIPAPVNGNRSGLGDGTNPGQGGGSVNSPNQGTLNPGGRP